MPARSLRVLNPSGRPSGAEGCPVRIEARVMTTAYHAKYYAHQLTRRSSASDVGRRSMSLFDACVDLNPHQIEAALFALRSPLSEGVILADEVRLGKTIEAGFVLCQAWAERRRRLLVICPPRSASIGVWSWTRSSTCRVRSSTLGRIGSPNATATQDRSSNRRASSSRPITPTECAARRLGAC